MDVALGHGHNRCEMGANDGFYMVVKWARAYAGQLGSDRNDSAMTRRRRSGQDHGEST